MGQARLRAQLLELPCMRHSPFIWDTEHLGKGDTTHSTLPQHALPQLSPVYGASHHVDRNINEVLHPGGRPSVVRLDDAAELIRQRALDGIDQIVAYLQPFDINPVRRGDELRTLERNLVNNEVDGDGLRALRAERGLENSAQSAPIFVLRLIESADTSVNRI